MHRRDKPSFRGKTFDPERARRNLLERDLMIAAAVVELAHSRAPSLVEVDGTKGLQEILAQVEAQFSPFP
jgi:hypothetical protein